MGQKLYNALLEEVVVTSIFINVKPEYKCDTIIFSTVNTRLHKESYSFEDLYYDLDDICDEEKSFIKWTQDNKDLILENETSFRAIKMAYMAGFGNGFAHKKNITYEEAMQK
ncbi:hypothetical protein EBZ38_07875 [bacterium]|nr:hypothetical protein [bacterium]